MQSIPYGADPEHAFRAALVERLGAAPEHLEPGRLTRYDDPDGRRGNRALWCVLYTDGRPAGAFGNWRTGERDTWTATGPPLTATERRQLREAAARASAQRDRERAEAQRIAAERARRMWDAATPATAAHPYVQRKRITGLGLRELGGELLVPLRDVGGTLRNLQRITAAGDKRYLRGGRVTGLYALLAPALPDLGRLYICEGYATGATIQAATRAPVAAAMSAGNLRAVAVAIRTARPRLELIVAADDDHRTPGNPGIAAGREAARAAGAALTWPTTCGAPDCTCTDYADVAHCGRLS